MTTLTEGVHALEFLLSEAPGSRSREAGVLNAGQSCVAGEVLGQILTAAAEVTNGDGNGTISAVTIGKDVEVGVYTLTCTAESANAGTFSVRTPSGLFLPALTVAAAYASTHINLTVGDGSEDWDTGDVIEVTVTAGDYEALDQDEDDGAQIAAAILISAIDATDADQNCAVIVRDAEVSSALLTWPADITADEQATATAQLAARGIVLR